MTDEEKKNETPKRRCIACCVAAPAAGMETVRALAICQTDGLEAAKATLCPLHAEMQQHAVRVNERATIPPSKEDWRTSIAAMKPGEQIVGTCRECGKLSILEKGLDGKINSAHENPLCDGYKKLRDAAKASGNLEREHLGVYDAASGQMRVLKPEELPS